MMLLYLNSSVTLLCLLCGFYNKKTSHIWKNKHPQNQIEKLCVREVFKSFLTRTPRSCVCACMPAYVPVRVLSGSKGTMLYGKALSVVEHSGPFLEIFRVLCGREEVNGSESTPLEMESTMDP